MIDKKYTQEELEAAYDCGYNHAKSYWVMLGIAIGFIIGCCIAYLKLKY